MPNNRALNYTLRLLNRRWYAESEIEEKLKKKGYSNSCINDVIQYLRNENYINDDRFVENWIRDRINLKPMGRIRIRYELYSKGINKQIVDEKLTLLLSDDLEYKLALDLTRKKMNSKFETSKDFAERVYGFLMRRGFTSYTISQVVRELDMAEEK